MIMERQLEEKPKKGQSKTIYTIRTKLIDLAVGFVGWFSIMTVVALIYTAIGVDMCEGAMILVILGLPIISLMQIIITLTLLRKRLWTGLGVVAAVVFNFALGILLGMSEGYYAFPVTSNSEFLANASNLFVNISAMTTNTTFEPAPANDSAVDVLARSGVTSNAEWTPYTQDFDGVMMALVPAGCFTMGDPYDQGGERCFDMPFWIDLTEVTNGQFSQFGGQARHASSSTGDHVARENITWFEAVNFCARRGARLLTEAEWEYAGRGPDNLQYPWGNEYDDYQTAETDSWVGARNMRGNVSEWVSSLFMEYPYNPTDGREAMFTFNPFIGRVGRGGDGELDWRRANPPTSHYDESGFRCGRPY
jgi:formylglycine-generating enzyme required for sulfatase activity